MNVVAPCSAGFNRHMPGGVRAAHIANAALSNRRQRRVAGRCTQENAPAAVTVSTYRALPVVPQVLRMFHG